MASETSGYKGSLARLLHRCCLIPWALLALAACESIPEQISSDDRAQIHNIGVVSLVQDTLDAAQAAGVFVFSNEYYTYPVRSWRLQQLSEDVVRGAIEQAGPYNLKDVTYEPGSISRRLAAETGFLEEGVFSAWPYPELSEVLKPVVEGMELDAVVVLFPGSRGKLCWQGRACDEYGRHGAGLIDRRVNSGIFGTKREMSAYISIKCHLLDGETLEPKAGRHINEKLVIKHLPLRLAIRYFEKQDQEYIKNSLGYLLKTHLPDCLKSLGSLD